MSTTACQGTLQSGNLGASSFCLRATSKRRGMFCNPLKMVPIHDATHCRTHFRIVDGFYPFTESSGLGQETP